MTTLGTRIRTLRAETGFTQEKFGRIFGVEKPTISLYESDKSTPNDDIKIQMCQYFNISLDYLLGRTDFRRPFSEIEAECAREHEGRYDNLGTHVENYLSDPHIPSSEKKAFILNTIQTYFNILTKKTVD